MSAKPLILGILSTYPLYYVKPFFASLKKSGYNGAVVIFTNTIDRSTENYLNELNILVIPYSNTWPYIQDQALAEHIPQCDQPLSPNSLRYLLYNAFLKANSRLHDKVLISDVRDVYFQRNPFDFPYKKGLSVFMEDTTMTIGRQEHNRYWIENGFGPTALQKLSEKPISCSGITIGDTDSMLDYFDKMIRYICSLVNIPGLDQGIHNYLLHTGSLPLAHDYTDDAGPVSTISAFKPKQAIRIENGKVVGIHGRVINIVHQYDRCDVLLIRWNLRYFVRHKINVMKGRLYFLKVLIKKQS